MKLPPRRACFFSFYFPERYHVERQLAGSFRFYVRVIFRRQLCRKHPLHYEKLSVDSVPSHFHEGSNGSTVPEPRASPTHSTRAGEDYDNDWKHRRISMSNGMQRVRYNRVCGNQLKTSSYRR